MKSTGDGARTIHRLGLIALGAGLLAVPHGALVNAAAAPQVSISANRVQIRAASTSLVETIDALGRVGNVKITYDGARPTVTLYNLDIDAPSIGQALFRLLEGQNVNYGVVFDLSGQRVTSLMILGVAPRSSVGAVGGGRPAPRSFPTPVAPEEPQEDQPAADDEPTEESDEAAEAAEPTPTPTGPARLAPPVSPFAPRPAFGNPFGPRPTPSLSPTPSA